MLHHIKIRGSYHTGVYALKGSVGTMVAAATESFVESLTIFSMDLSTKKTVHFRAYSCSGIMVCKTSPKDLGDGSLNR